MSSSGVTSMISNVNTNNLLRFSFTPTTTIPSSTDPTRG